MWMNKKDVNRYRAGIEAYLADKGKLDSIVGFMWGFKATVSKPEDEDDCHYYTFEYQGEDQFSVEYVYVDWENTPEDDFGDEITVNGGFIHVR